MSSNEMDREESRRVIARYVVEALSRSGRHRSSDVASVSTILAEPFNGETTEASRVVPTQSSVTEINEADDAVREIIYYILVEGDQVADLVIAHLDSLVAHLQAIDCVTRYDVFEYFAAGDRVLAQLHAELRKPRPSPTKMKQLVTQYALDPRRAVEAPAHQIEFRPHSDGYEVSVLPVGQVRLRSIPHAGQVVRTRYAVRLLNFLSQPVPPYSEMMEFVEMLLECIPDDAPPNSPTTPSIAICVHGDASEIEVRGVRYSVDLPALRFVQALLRTPGNWVSSTELQEDLLFQGVRFDRLCAKLPEELRELIESVPGKGYRLRIERLA